MVGVFVGSFDPYTIGHDNILRRALPLFDKIVIGVGVNVNKQCMLSAEERVSAIAEIYADEPKVKVRQYTDLTCDFAHREGASYIIKGIRSVKDFEYEREQADILRQITGVDTMLFFSEPHLQSVSSSAVRELKRFGKDITAYLPKKQQ
ncbi:MAG: pantetheine-phosphate adenylyltransferase [Prevotella sp.]|nr:pantetheine-phosphate adenylyltransferase [Prevotella sp.]